MSTMKAPKPVIRRSTNYSEFAFLPNNRPIDTSHAKYRKLYKKMEKEGWIPSYPATVFIKGGKKFLIDGQNRFTAAKEQGKAILYVIVDKNYNIPELSDTVRGWSSNDYAGSHAGGGNPHYVKLVEFYKKHRITAARAAALLMAKTFAMRDCSSKPAAAVRTGTFKFSEEGREYAESVLAVCSYLPVKLRKNRAANAAIARVCLVPEVDVTILAQKIKANIGHVVPKTTVDDYVQLFEVIYNKRNQNPIPLTLRVLEFTRRKAA